MQLFEKIEGPELNGPLCTHCGAKKTYREVWLEDRTIEHTRIECGKCGWATWVS